MLKKSTKPGQSSGTAPPNRGKSAGGTVRYSPLNGVVQSEQTSVGGCDDGGSGGDGGDGKQWGVETPNAAQVTAHTSTIELIDRCGGTHWRLVMRDNAAANMSVLRLQPSGPVNRPAATPKFSAPVQFAMPRLLKTAKGGGSVQSTQRCDSGAAGNEGGGLGSGVCESPPPRPQRTVRLKEPSLVPYPSTTSS